MIKESLYFSFAGVKSTDFGITNITVERGLFEESVVADKTINEVSVRGNPTPYFFDISEEPKVIELSFHFSEGYTDELFDRVIRWLNVDYYQPLFFSEDIDKVFYCIPTNGINHIHNGLKEGYLTLNMRCNSSKSFSHEQSTPFYDFYNKPANQSSNLEIVNRGHYSIYPEIFIEKLADGDITINNLSNRNQLFKFKNIDVGEQLYIDCKNEFIKSSKEDIWRYDDFNDEYLELVYGINILKISNNIKIKFKYNYIFA